MALCSQLWERVVSSLYCTLCVGENGSKVFMTFVIKAAAALLRIHHWAPSGDDCKERVEWINYSIEMWCVVYGCNRFRDRCWVRHRWRLKSWQYLKIDTLAMKTENWKCIKVVKRDFKSNEKNKLKFHHHQFFFIISCCCWFSSFFLFSLKIFFSFFKVHSTIITAIIYFSTFLQVHIRRWLPTTQGEASTAVNGG